MANALTLHMEHEEALQKSTEQLEMSNRQLVAEKELNQQLVKEKISQARKQKKLIKELEVSGRGWGMKEDRPLPPACWPRPSLPRPRTVEPLNKGHIVGSCLLSLVGRFVLISEVNLYHFSWVGRK